MSSKRDRQLRQALNIIRRQFQVMQDQREMILQQNRIIEAFEIANQTLLDLHNKPAEKPSGVALPNKWVN